MAGIVAMVRRLRWVNLKSFVVSGHVGGICNSFDSDSALFALLFPGALLYVEVVGVLLYVDDRLETLGCGNRFRFGLTPKPISEPGTCCAWWWWWWWGGLKNNSKPPRLEFWTIGNPPIC